MFFFFFKQKTAYEIYQCDWSSDVCSSDLIASPPVVKIENTIGAGDSAVAGFVYGLSGDKTLKEALVCAVAAGTATTLRPGTALCRKEDFLRLVPQIILKGD